MPEDFALYGFGPKQLLILCKKKQGRVGASLEPDRRGKHDKHVAVNESLKYLVREHIQSFPVTHSRIIEGECTYLQSSL